MVISTKSTLVTILIVLGLSATGIAIIQRVRQKPIDPLSPAQIHEPMERQREGTIDDEIALAKRKGKHELNVFAPTVDRPESLSLDEALKDASVFLAEPIDRRVYWDGNYTVSWWKFKISETLARAPVPTECLSCWRPDNPPTDWLPLPSDEIIFRKYGGTVTREGIQISTVEADFPDFVGHQSYLLFLVAGDDNVAAARMGAMSAFRVSSTGIVTPLMNKIPGKEWRLADELAEKDQSSIHLLQSEVSRRKAEGKLR
ncbi:MAG TPA: hypothetical protein VE961_14040 [Pyrinomonadaceae bacterium]|nr:hypothetical protein [Pyrinomonadaceae bacterium]